MALIGLSGPVSNFILAIILSIPYKFIPPASITEFVIAKFIYINVMLGVFNLVPIPPLDGSRVVMGILPKDLSYRYAAIEPYGFFIILAAFWIGLLDKIVWPIVISIMGLLGAPL